MISKCDQMRAAWAADDKIAALRIAAHFFDRSDDTKTFKRGMDAYNNPSFYLQLGKDPDLLIAEALELLSKKFNLGPINNRHEPGWEPERPAKPAGSRCRGLS
jgi:hypothetical protein